MDLRTSWLSIALVEVQDGRVIPHESWSSVGCFGDIHFVQFRLSTTRNLLRPQLHELLLEVIELLLQFILVLAPELRGLDFAGRLQNLCQFLSNNSTASECHRIPF